MSDVFPCPLNYFAKKSPDQIALIANEESYTYKQADRKVSQLCNSLQNLSVGPGDKVAFLPLHPLTPLLFFALFRLGSIACPLNIYYPLTALPAILDKMGAHLLIAPLSLDHKLPPIKQDKALFDRLFATPTQKNHEGCPFLQKSALATFLATSGTTSEPKIAAHSLGNHYYSALGLHSTLYMDAKSRYLLSLPLYHVAGIGIMWRTFLKGATLVMQEPSKPLHEQLLDQHISHLSLVETQLIELLNTTPDPSKLCRHLKAVLLGGSSLQKRVIDQAWQWGLPVMPSYGSTEMSSTITVCQERGLSNTVSAGLTLPYRELFIDNASRILVRGKTLFQGYLNEQGTLIPPAQHSGFFYTKDRGVMDPKRGLYVLGREDRMFISGGENIHPEEIELALLSHPHIKAATVLPSTDAHFGMIPSADIQATHPLTYEEIKHLLSQSLPNYKIPKQIKINHN